MTKDALAPTPDLETLIASIADLTKKSQGFLERRSGVDRILEEAHNQQSQLHDERISLSVERHRLREERERLLRAELDSRGLGICSAEGNPLWTDPHKRFDSWSELNKLGVFPKDRMTMVYTAHTAIQRTSDYDGRERRRGCLV